MSLVDAILRTPRRYSLSDALNVAHKDVLRMSLNERCIHKKQMICFSMFCYGTFCATYVKTKTVGVYKNLKRISRS